MAAKAASSRWIARSRWWGDANAHEDRTAASVGISPPKHRYWAGSYLRDDRQEGSCLAVQHPPWPAPTNRSAPDTGWSKLDHKLVTLPASLPRTGGDE
jgi:hypothetical protein